MRIVTALLFASLFALPSMADQVVLERDAGATVSCTVDATTVTVTGIFLPSCSDPFCGDGNCDSGETACTCTDCGIPPSAEDLCGDGIDNDCDGLVDCADGDCSADSACAAPPAGSPPLVSLEGWWSWDNAHAVTCDTMPVNTLCMGCQPPVGSCIHHLLDQATEFPVRELTEVDPQWWPEAQSDSIAFGGDDQLRFQTCTSLDPLQCSDVPWDLAATDSWSIVVVGMLTRDGYLVGYPSGGTTGLASYVVVWPNTSTFLRIGGQSRTLVGSLPINKRLALLIERQADRVVKIWTREACSVTLNDRSSGNLATTAAPAFGCISCYFPNGVSATDPTAPGMLHLREAMIYRRDFSNLTDRGNLLSYLESEHGAWIDEGCVP